MVVPPPPRAGWAGAPIVDLSAVVRGTDLKLRGVSQRFTRWVGAHIFARVKPISPSRVGQSTHSGANWPTALERLIVPGTMRWIYGRPPSSRPVLLSLRHRVLTAVRVLSDASLGMIDTLEAVWMRLDVGDEAVTPAQLPSSRQSPPPLQAQASPFRAGTSSGVHDRGLERCRGP